LSNEDRYSEDRALVERILAGSEADWHGFIARYTPLINATVRRYVHDEDSVKTVWANILDGLYKGRLRTWEARSLLSTWLVVVARSAAIDHLRAEKGRPRRPDNWDELSDLGRAVYELMFVQRRTPDETRHILAARGELPAGVSLAEIVAELEEQLGDRTLRRLAWDIHAASVGGVSGRLLEYLEHAAEEAAERGLELSPERQLLHTQARRTLDRVHEAMQALPEQERRALELRFHEGWQAERIGAELGVPRRRDVYTLLDRAVRHVRKILGFNILAIACLASRFFR
jgi:RNA polymerase sigma factor (sigma-70 family)